MDKNNNGEIKIIIIIIHIIVTNRKTDKSLLSKEI